MLNTQPNVALLVRAMQDSEELKNDLCFIILKDAKEEKDILIMLVSIQIACLL